MLHYSNLAQNINSVYVTYHHDTSCFLIAHGHRISGILQVQQPETCHQSLVPVCTVRLIKKFTFRTVVNIHICVVHLTYLTLLLPRTYVLAGVRVVRVYRLKFLRSLAN